MFDSVGRNLDDEANKRRGQSLLLMVVVGGVTAGFSLGLGAFTASKVLLDDGSMDEEMVEVVLEDVQLDEAPPPPPPPPPPPAPEEMDEEESEEEEDTTPTPDEMDEEVADLDENPDEKMRSETKPKGVKGGVEGGVEGGSLDGVIGGVLTDGPVGPRVFHHSEVEVKRRVLPRYPEAARALDLGDVSCKLRVFIDESGVPYDLHFEACPTIFHPPSRDAIMKWRWYPARAGRTKVKAQFVINVKYRLQ